MKLFSNILAVLKKQYLRKRVVLSDNRIKTNMFRKFYLYFLLLFSALSFAQIGGKSAYQFLNMVTSPRQAALGGKNITIYDNDVNQGIYNPASINQEMDSHLSMNYGSYYGEVAYGTAAYAYTYDKHLQTFHAGINYV